MRQKGRFLTFDFAAKQSDVLFAYAGGDEKEVAPFVNLQLSLQQGGGDGVILGDDMTTSVGQQGSQGFGGGCHLTDDLEAAAREVGDEGVGGVEMGVSSQFLDIVPDADAAECAPFEEGGMGVVEISSGAGGVLHFGGGFAGSGETVVMADAAVG